MLLLYSLNLSAHRVHSVCSRNTVDALITTLLTIFLPWQIFRNAYYSQNRGVLEAKRKQPSVGIHFSLAMRYTEISFGKINKGCLMSQDKELNIEFKWPEYQGQSMPFLSQIKGELWACTELFPVFSSSK